jgi:reactive intermediate/imine deaminase
LLTVPPTEQRADVTPIQPPQWPPPAGHYSPAVTSGPWVFVSGQLPIAASGPLPADAPFAEQVRQVLDNLQVVLETAGSGLDCVVRVTAYVVGVAHWAEFNRVYAEVMGAHRPARSVVPVPQLHHGYLIEVEAVAELRVPTGTPPSGSAAHPASPHAPAPAC